MTMKLRSGLVVWLARAARNLWSGTPHQRSWASL